MKPLPELPLDETPVGEGRFRRGVLAVVLMVSVLTFSLSFETDYLVQWDCCGCSSSALIVDIVVDVAFPLLYPFPFPFPYFPLLLMFLYSALMSIGG